MSHQWDFARNAGQWTPESDHPDPYHAVYTGLSERELCTRCDGTGKIVIFHDADGSGQPLIDVCQTGDSPHPCSRHEHEIRPCDECVDGEDGD